jgi:hypothetical protein
LDTFFVKSINASKKACEPLTFLDSDIISNGIISVDELKIAFQAQSAFGTIIDTGQYTISFTNSEE